METHGGKEDAEVVAVKGKPATEETKSWKDFLLKEQQETPQRLEDAAKFLSGMISVSLTIFLSLFGKNSIAGLDRSMVSILLLLWVASLMFSFLVLFPKQYHYSTHSIQTFQAAHKKIIKLKRFLLILSLVFYLISLVILGLLFLFKKT
ncbi:MAG: hypothetical protein GY940_24690 [bacterium]|nr:hypothetical protein [bacterium]